MYSMYLMEYNMHMDISEFYVDLVKRTSEKFRAKIFPHLSDFSPSLGMIFAPSGHPVPPFLLN